MAKEQSERKWPVQDAKARFSELLEASLNEGPQIVTRRGVEAAVLVPFEEWRRLQSSARPTLKELLLAETPRAELPISPRRRWRRRPPVTFE
jgi:antitoxin Phd